MASSPARATLAAVAWLGTAAVSAWLLTAARNPALLIAFGCALAVLEPERDAPGWSGFLSAVCLRVADVIVVAGVAWYLASQHDSPRSAATAAAVLALGIVAPYVRVRAASLSIGAGALRKPSYERAVWLGIVASATWIGMPDAPDALVGGLAAAGAWSLGTAATRAVRVWRSATTHG